VIKLLLNYTSRMCRSPTVYELWPSLHLFTQKLIKSVSFKITHTHTHIYIYIYIYILYPQFHFTSTNESRHEINRKLSGIRTYLPARGIPSLVEFHQLVVFPVYERYIQ